MADDSAFAETLLCDGIDAMLTGDVERCRDWQRDPTPLHLDGRLRIEAVEGSG
jgi:hypothetical protein